MNIKTIDSLTSQKIGSSQVVVSMCAAVKELIENSLDACSNKIEINLKNFGADLIEVIDDGNGISPDDFHNFTQRHTTYKIEQFEDLNSLNSFGFRGEALNSLCFLGDVQIHTRCDSSEVGTLMKFDQVGKITSKNSLARQRGTTVSIRNIFHSLPVRRKQFVANLRKEYDRTVKYIIGFCLICDNVQISCYRNDKTKKLVVSTTGTEGIAGNIISIFGIKQLKSMMELKITEHNVPQDILDEFNLKSISGLDKIQLSGWISRPADGISASNSDKQFLYVNGRPCELLKVKKLVLDCYRTINKTQTPAFVLLITLPKEAVDINIEPDKRLFFLDNQKEVFAVIKASIVACFGSCGFSKDSTAFDKSLESINRSLLHHKTLPISVNNSSISVLQTPRTPCKRLSTINSEPENTLKLAKLHQFLDESVSTTKLIVSEVPEKKFCRINSKSVKINFSIDLLKKFVNERRNDEVSSGGGGGYKSSISRDCDDRNAENELKKIFHKSYFGDLELIGQFNRGFIVARKAADLFIIDQHASDEKNQFEKLMDQCKMSSQPLVRPHRLHFSASDEEIIRDHLELFEKAGFRFKFEESDDSFHVYLSATACRNKLILGSEDLQEMIQFIKDKKGTSVSFSSVMPSRVKSAIASNACRTAVMIGTCLSRLEMEQIIRNMGVMREPWTCAHGRPTMRYLYCLDSIL